MSTLHVLEEGETVMLTKGALDVLLDRSVSLLTSDGVVELTQERREQILSVNQALSSQGLRVLAFAFRGMLGARQVTLEDERDYTFIGLISMIDPPRPEAVQAVTDAKRGGIRTVMITGDHKVTASRHCQTDRHSPGGRRGPVRRGAGRTGRPRRWTRSWSTCPSTPGCPRSTRSALSTPGSGRGKLWP